MVAPEAPRVD